MTSSNENIFRVTGHLWGEFTGHRWIPLTKASDADLDVSFDLRVNKPLSKQSWGWWFEVQLRSLRRHCNEGGVVLITDFQGHLAIYIDSEFKKKTNVQHCVWTPYPGVEPPYPAECFPPYSRPPFFPIFFRVPPSKIQIFRPRPFAPVPRPFFVLSPRPPNPRAPVPPVLPHNVALV